MAGSVVMAPSTDPIRQARLNRIRVFSLTLARGCILLAALLTVGLLFYWFSASTASIAAVGLVSATRISSEVA